jgi:hypothetical protein
MLENELGDVMAMSRTSVNSRVGKIRISAAPREWSLFRAIRNGKVAVIKKE